MPLSLIRRTTSAHFSMVITTQTIGFVAVLPISASFLATPSQSTKGGVTKLRRRESMFGSLRSVSTVPPYCSGPAVATTSTGLETMASVNRSLPRASFVSVLNSASFISADMHSSTEMMAGPPVLVTMTTRSPVGTG